MVPTKIKKKKLIWKKEYLLLMEDDCMFLQNAGIYLQVHMVLQQRRPTYYYLYS
jgi:hypothetical protein